MQDCKIIGDENNHGNLVNYLNLGNKMSIVDKQEVFWTTKYYSWKSDNVEGCPRANRVSRASRQTK